MNERALELLGRPACEEHTTIVSENVYHIMLMSSRLMY